VNHSNRIHHLTNRLLSVATTTILAVLFLTGSLLGGEETKSKAEKLVKKASAVEVRFVDDSTMKLTLVDERIELETPHGKLLIPVADVRQIDFGWRIPDEVAKRIGTAVADLGHKDFKRRQTATDDLLEIGAQAYPALLKAAKHADAEVARRAQGLLEKIRQTVPAERLEIRPHDVIHTETSKIAGRISVSAFKVKTVQFGEQQLKLLDMRCMRTPLAVVVAPTVTQGLIPSAQLVQPHLRRW
jgi:hypothetical protein